MPPPPTLTANTDPDAPDRAAIDPFDAGFLVGILVGEGHFGGDGRQPQVTLRMHTDHASVFQWLMDRFPDSRLYGPYAHSGRSYYQWMARGPFLRTVLLPILEQHLRPEHSERAWQRYQEMRARYRLDPQADAAGPAPRS